MAFTGTGDETTNVVPYAATVLDWNGATGPILQITAIISFLCSSSVVITGILFYKQLTQKKLYMKLLMMVSFCDAMGSIGSMLGYPDNPDACAAQGGLIFMFYRASWMWATSISFSLYCQVIKGRLLLTFKSLSIIIWTLSIILEFAPLLVGMSYGNCYRFAPSVNFATTFGTLSANGEGPIAAARFEHWIGMTFVMPMSINLLVMFGIHFIVGIWVEPSLKASNTEVSKRILKCLQNAQSYPLLMLMCWVPHVIVFLLVSKLGLLREAYLLIQFSFAWGATMGFWLSILYFSRSAESRKLWSIFIYGEASGYHAKNIMNTYVDDQRSSDRGSNSNIEQPTNTSTNASIGTNNRQNSYLNQVSTDYSYENESEDNENSESRDKVNAMRTGPALSFTSSASSQMHSLNEVEPDFESDDVYYTAASPLQTDAAEADTGIELRVSTSNV